MKTILAVIGAITLAIVAIVALLVVHAALTLRPLLKEAQTYVDSAVPAIAAKWDSKELINRGTPLLIASATPEAIDPLFLQMRSLGNLTKYEGSSCFVAQVASTSGATTGANCDASAQYENGSAVFRLNLIKAKGEWRINGFFFRGHLSAQNTPAISFGLGESDKTSPTILAWPITQTLEILKRMFGPERSSE